MNCRVGIPDIQALIESPQLLGILANRSYDNRSHARSFLRLLLHPIGNGSTDSTLVVKQQDWRGLLFDLHNSNSFHDSYGCLTRVRMFDTSGLGPSSRPTTAPFRNMIRVGVPWISERSASSRSTAMLTLKIFCVNSTISATC